MAYVHKGLTSELPGDERPESPVEISGDGLPKIDLNHLFRREVWLIPVPTMRRNEVFTIDEGSKKVGTNMGEALLLSGQREPAKVCCHPSRWEILRDIIEKHQNGWVLNRDAPCPWSGDPIDLTPEWRPLEDMDEDMLDEIEAACFVESEEGAMSLDCPNALLEVLHEKKLRGLLEAESK